MVIRNNDAFGLAKKEIKLPYNFHAARTRTCVYHRRPEKSRKKEGMETTGQTVKGLECTKSCRESRCRERTGEGRKVTRRWRGMGR